MHGAGRHHQARSAVAACSRSPAAVPRPELTCGVEGAVAAVVRFSVLPTLVTELMEHGAGVAKQRGLRTAWTSHAGVGVVTAALGPPDRPTRFEGRRLGPRRVARPWPAPGADTPRWSGRPSP